jgi:hypothetical protein
VSDAIAEKWNGSTEFDIRLEDIEKRLERLEGGKE